MRIQHKPSDAMQADWVGTIIPYFNSVTGTKSAAYLFVAVLPCSCYAYVEACDDIKQKNGYYVTLTLMSIFWGLQDF